MTETASPRSSAPSAAAVIGLRVRNTVTRVGRDRSFGVAPRERDENRLFHRYLEQKPFMKDANLLGVETVKTTYGFHLARAFFFHYLTSEKGLHERMPY